MRLAVALVLQGQESLQVLIYLFVWLMVSDRLNPGIYCSPPVKINATQLL